MNSISFSKLAENSFILGVLFLPVYQTINHWFFGVSILFSLVSFIYLKKNQLVKPFFRLVIFLCISFFLLRLFTMFYASDIDIAVVELQRALPFLLYPLCVFSIKNQKEFNFKKFESKIFWALTAGCLITVLICWGNIVLNMEENPIPANQIFGWRKSGVHLTKILDIHPPYLGMLISGSIIFLFREYLLGFLNKKMKISILVIILVLLVFLFNLTARNAIFYLLALSIGFFIYNRQWKFIVGTFLICSVALIVIINHPSEYYRLKMYHMLGISENSSAKDKRFERLDASFEVFRSYPLLGAGLGKDLELKIEYYKKMNDEIAIKRKLNSHNQFFEYLAAYGILGGLFFIFVIFGSIYIIFKHKQYFYLLLLLNIFLASITESIFERALGIQYYSIIISISLLSIFNSTSKLK